VFVFNPFSEGRLAEGRAFNPTKHQTQLACDLENLPQYLCRQDDILLTGRKPSVEFLSRIKRAGFPLPEFVESSEFARQRLATRKLGSLRPWAWGPDSIELLKPIFPNVTGEKRPAEKRFNPGLAQLYSKAWSANFLRNILSKTSRQDQSQTVKRPPDRDWLCAENEIGVPVRSLEEALAVIAGIRSRGQLNVVVKQAFGVAGGNALRLLEPCVLEAQLRWMRHAFAQKRELVVEPWLNRLQDFSIQLEMTPKGLKLYGFTGLVSDARGQFVANFAESHFHQRIPTRVAAQFRQPMDVSGQLLDFYDLVFECLEAELRALDFIGPLGLDAFVYKDSVGAVRLKPVVEINPRYTMGRVLVELMRQTSQNCAGIFRLANAVQLRSEGFADFAAYARDLEEKYPLQFEGQPMPRICEGALCLNDPAAAKACLAVFHVSRTPHFDQAISAGCKTSTPRVESPMDNAPPPRSLIPPSHLIAFVGWTSICVQRLAANYNSKLNCRTGRKTRGGRKPLCG
jgi:hypothetical protein